MEIKINGVYSKELVSFFKGKGINNFGFDLRPTSFNFIQLHVIKYVLSKINSQNNTFTFLFQNEKDFVIKELIGFLEEDQLITKEQVLLEFTDVQDIDECESHKMNYIWHFNDMTNYRKISGSEFLRVISIAQSQLEIYQQSQELFPLIKEINSLKNESNLLDLRLDWTDSLQESIIDFIQPQLFTLEINNTVQSCYRNVNKKLVEDHLIHLEQQIKGSLSG